jgi:hypothetical protein
MLMIPTSGCGWQRQLEFHGPGDSTLAISQPWPANGWGLRIEVCRGKVCEVIHSVRGDVFLLFADVNWSPDNRTVAVVTCGEPYVRLAYDRTLKKAVSFSQFESALRSQIGRDYALDGTIDALKWACSEEAARRFSALHPGFRQR